MQNLNQNLQLVIFYVLNAGHGVQLILPEFQMDALVWDRNQNVLRQRIASCIFVLCVVVLISSRMGRYVGWKWEEHHQACSFFGNHQGLDRSCNAAGRNIRVSRFVRACFVLG